MSKQAEIRDRITAEIIQALNKGTAPWKKPWSAHRSGQPSGPTNANTKRRYRGINIMLLMLHAQRFGFTSNYWATFNQWRGMGARIKPRPADVQPGAWGCKVAFYLPLTPKDKAVDDDQDQEEEDEKPRFYMKEFTVFNGDQTDLDQFHGKAQDETAPIFVDFQPAEKAIEATEARIKFGGERAYYSPSGDYIQLPYRQNFVSTSEFYATCTHELIHWTGHPSRLNRKNFDDGFGSESYAFEELVAEVGGFFTCTELGVPQSENMDNHNAYLANWLKVLENDHTAILRASSLASKAADFIMAFSKQEAVAQV